MIKFSNVQIDQIAIHRVGNKHRAERNFISAALYSPNDYMQDTLLKFFLKPFKRNPEWLRFRHATDLKYNELYSFSSNIFEDPTNLLAESVNILEHLYRQSDHPNIKSGELYVASFTGISYDGLPCEAYGIFKTEEKAHILKVTNEGDMLALDKLEGINLGKLDKGALILKAEAGDGYRVLCCDNNSYDAAYWPDRFLNIDFVHDDNFHTRSYLQLVNDFSKEVIIPAENQQQQVKFLANSVDYFGSNDYFDFDDFSKEVLPSENMADDFKEYQKTYALDGVNQFAISKPAFKTASRRIYDTIKLNTGIQIKLDINDPSVTERFIEKGYDEERKMHFYKVYFDEEVE